jgi:ABC-type glycerol-3-phosphate transport system substrate-binding protein
LEDVEQSGLLTPLEQVIPQALQDDLYPFGRRDTDVNGNWVALPLIVSVEHGVARAGESSRVPLILDRMVREDAPTWVFAGQAGEDGQMTNALLLQWLSLLQQAPAPDVLPVQEELVALFATFQEAQRRGTIPRANLLVNDEALLFDRLLSNQADFIESSSLTYLREQNHGSPVAFAPIPTLKGNMMAVIDGYLIALTTDDPREQEAAVSLIEWFSEPERLAEWSRISSWLPARRSVLPLAVESGAYRVFLDEQLSHGWLRPSGTAWRSFAQAIQEHFRAVMTEQASPTDAAAAIFEGQADRE